LHVWSLISYFINSFTPLQF